MAYEAVLDDAEPAGGSDPGAADLPAFLTDEQPAEAEDLPHAAE